MLRIIDTKENGHSGSFRVLSMFERLSRKEILCKEEEAKRFRVDKKTIQRDIEELRTYWGDSENNQGLGEIKYCKKNKGYMLIGNSETWLTNEQILAAARVLLESRAFSKNEMDELLKKLVLQCHPAEAKRIKEIISNELHHYVAVQHGKPLLQSIWELSQAVREQKLVKISYRRIDQEVVERLIKPQGVMFAEYYFYLIGNIHDKDFNDPSVYRIDRILSYQITEDKFSFPYVNRFEEGQFRKRVQFMQTGKMIKIQFKYWGVSEEAILDRLPNARVVKREDNIRYIEAEVFGRGIKMWLLSQAEYLEVLSPPEFRAEIEDTIERMNKIYRKAEPLLES
ncbi:helix-turn-helix transcriptional regulator [Pelosinus sp. sgz500959]|uniref:helix-turn-helix transcriptional regulator n=1 Tax=Pelosinus sp. sgz500959 TaxID=3242472 RepID=UPI00366F5931